MTNYQEALPCSQSWRSLTAVEGGHVHGFFEADFRFPRERVTEHGLRLIGTLVMLAGILHWFIPGLFQFDDPTRVRLALTVMFVATGISLYIFASRGFRRVLQIDLGERRITMARVNSHDRSMFSRHFSIEDIESIVVQRASSGRSGYALLEIRVKQSASSFIVLGGERSEIEQLHRHLCKMIKTALDCAPKRVAVYATQKFSPKTPRPERRHQDPEIAGMLATEPA